MTNEPARAATTSNTVLELLDRVLNTGVVLVGEVTITVADIELVYLRLQLLLSSAETARKAGWLPAPHYDRTAAVRHSGGERIEAYPIGDDRS